MRWSVIHIVGLLLILTTATYSQQLLSLQGEGNGSVVKLKWVPQQWPSDLEGVAIKRKVKGNSSWDNIHDDIIYPAQIVDRDFSQLDKSSEEQQKLVNKLKKLIASGNARVISRANFYAEILSKPAILKNVRLGFLVDYDLTLISGFGFVDRNVPAGKDLEYGLFLKYKDRAINAQPSETFRWKSGQSLDMTLTMTSRIIRSGKKGDLMVIWNVDTEEMSKKGVAGFNIYRKKGNGAFNRLNDHVIFVSIANKREQLVHQDHLEDITSDYTFAAVPVSAFGTEGTPNEIRYEVANNAIIRSPKIVWDEEAKSGNAGLLFRWEFEKGQEGVIKGFQVERKTKTEDPFKPVSTLLTPSTRQYADLSIPDRGYYFYRLTTITQQNERLEGPTTLIYYTQQQHPPVPEGLTVKLNETRNAFVLNWNSKKPSDTLTRLFHIYVGNPSDHVVYDEGLPLISGSSYVYKIKEPIGGTWKFALSAVSSSGSESDLTEKVTVILPSLEVPPVNTARVSRLSNKAKITWTYNNTIHDLAGFRIYQDGNLIADEKTVAQGMREWTTGSLEDGTKHLYEIMAVTESGVESLKRVAGYLDTAQH